MKKMNNYEAPKAEVIELYTNKDLMSGWGPGGTNNGQPMNTGGQAGSY